MIRSISLTDFKSYREAIIPLSRVTFIVGANASGKSNALEALRFLGWLGQGKRLDEIERGFSLRKPSSRTRGNASDLFRFGTTAFLISAKIDSCESDNSNEIDWSIEIRQSTGQRKEASLVNFFEKASVPGRDIPRYETVTTPNGMTNSTFVSYDNFTKGPNKPRIECANDQAIFYQLLSPTRFQQRKSKDLVPLVAGTIRNAFENILFLDPDPSAMREMSDLSPGTKIAEDGSNVSSILQSLCADQKIKQTVLSLVRSLPEQDLTDIDFVVVPELNKVMLRLQENFGEKRKVQASLLSDGTLRALAVAAALCGVPEHSVVVIEEIDNGIHPGRARDLVSGIQAIAAKRNIQVVVTTHNPALMDAIPRGDLPDVLCCFRDLKDGSSRIRRLGDLPDFTDLVLADRLGALTTSGNLEKSVKDGRTREQLAADRVKWFENFLARTKENEE